ncbi:GIY-YIG nuclease family protein [Nostoc sp. CHAB 5834]|nr:GIY-YIG nuclease family protein [Nostoc sp. CHAB 5834]
MQDAHKNSIAALYRHFEAGNPLKHALLFCRLARATDIDLHAVMQLHPLRDDWLDFSFDALSQYFERAGGHIYVAHSPLDEGVCKVGKTSQAADKRIQQLNNESTRLPFQLRYSLEVWDRHWVEAKAHSILKGRGLHAGKEFFRVSPEQVAEVVEAEQSRDQARFRKQQFYGV